MNRDDFEFHNPPLMVKPIELAVDKRINKDQVDKSHLHLVTHPKWIQN